MDFLETYGKEIVSVIVPFIGWVLNTVYKTRAKLLLSSPHNFTFLIQEPPFNPEGVQVAPNQTVQTSSIILRNAGRETATNVELVFNWKPPFINFWPSRHYTEHIEPDNRYSLIFESLAPNETVGCEMFSINAPLPMIIVARSDQCVAKNIEMYPMPIFKPWQNRLALFFMLAGLGVTIYLVIYLLQFLILKTPPN